MKSTYKYILSALLVAGSLVACSPDDIEGLNESGVPQASNFEDMVEITVDQSTNQVTFNLKNAKGVYPVWNIDTGKKIERSTVNGYQRIVLRRTATTTHNLQTPPLGHLLQIASRHDTRAYQVIITHTSHFAVIFQHKLIYMSRLFIAILSQPKQPLNPLIKRNHRRYIHRPEHTLRQRHVIQTPGKTHHKPKANQPKHKGDGSCERG